MKTLASFAAGRASLRSLGVSPGQYQVLVDLFGALGERREVANQLGSNAGAMRLTSAALLIPGAFIALTAFGPASLASYNLTTTVLTSFVLFLLLVMEATESFFNPAEAIVLAHRPIGGATYFAAKFTYLVVVVWRAELALNGPAAVAGLMKPGARWFYPLTHMAAAWTAGLFVALISCALLGGLFRLLPSSRVRNAALWMQLVAITIPLAFGPAARPLQRVAVRMLPHSIGAGWSLLPFAWFNALAVVGQTRPVTPLGWPALVGAAASAIFIAFGIRSLSVGYMTRIASVMRAGRRSRRRARRSVGGRVVRLLSGSPSGRAAFGFLTRMMASDWQFRRAALQFTLVAVIGAPAIVLSGRTASPFEPDRLSLIGLLPEFLPFFTMMVCSLLAYSDHYRGAWIFATATDAGRRGYVRGIYWSICLLFLAVPLAAATIFYAPYWGPRDALLFGAYGLAVASLLLGAQLLLIDGLPFGHPPRPARTYGLMAVIMFGPVVLGIAWIAQGWLIYRSRWGVVAATAVFTCVAVVVVRYGLRELAMKIGRDLARMGGASQGMFESADG
ncbi:MAG TPA: hypothetical protein VHD57_06360 [Vicinamibacterales bacterium]|nr:hypothetical protein [Vicinamibacterales bacterium]